MQLNFNKSADKYLLNVINELEEFFQFQEIFELNNFEAKCLQHVSVNQTTWVIGFLNCENFFNLGAEAFKIFQNKNLENLTINLKKLNKEQTEQFIYGFFARNYQFTKYKTKKTECKLKNINILSEMPFSPKETELFLFEIETAKQIKNWVNQAPCHLFPMHFAKEIQEFTKDLNIKVKIIKGEEIKKMGLLYAVGKASENEPCCLIMEYTHENASQTIAFAGKGVTYDTGGLSLKPSNYMCTMKSDMAGAATVVGIVANAAKQNLQKNIIGIVGLVENSIGSKAFRPDDICFSYKNRSVEITNTDAEGRLVLADLFEYVQEHYQINTLIDLATLTGHAKIALGSSFSALFCNNETLANGILKSGLITKEQPYLLPFHEDYDKAMNSKIADIKNAELTSGPGCSTAAAFLKFFVNESTNWAHLDIASVAFLDQEKYCSSHGATAYGLKLFSHWLRNC